MDKDEKGRKEEEKDMSAILEQKRLDIIDKLKRISSKAPILKGRDDMIELNPNNPEHKEWFEEDEKGN